MKNYIDGEQSSIREVLGSDQANQGELAAHTQRPAAADLGSVLMLADVAQAVSQMPKLTTDELRLLAAYNANEDCRRFFDSVIQLANRLP